MSQQLGRRPWLAAFLRRLRRLRPRLLMSFSFGDRSAMLIPVNRAIPECLGGI